MEYRYLGRSGVRVSTLTMGTMTFGGVGWAKTTGSTGQDDATRQVAMALDAGVNLFDTANTYSFGRSEEILGQALGRRRDDVLIATKMRLWMGDGPNDDGASRYSVIRQCEGSLRRLGTDHIDLYQLHEWDGRTPLDETLGALDDLVRAGKVRYIGVSNYTGWQLMKALGVSERGGLARFVSEQIHYSLQAREAEYELLPAALDQGLGVLVWSPLAGGLLSGKYRRDDRNPAGTRRFDGWTEPPVRDEEGLYTIVDALVEVGEAHGVSAAQVALAWLLTRPAVSSVIVGARTEAQLADNLAAADLVLTADDLAALERASAIPLLYPYWHQANSASERLSDADLSLIARYLS
jgi:aryl-alcohol dehydrogenase-like predicted oxidoreductase